MTGLILSFIGGGLIGFSAQPKYLGLAIAGIVILQIAMKL